MSKLIDIIGPPPSKILLRLSRDGFKMIKEPIQENGKIVKRRALEMADSFRRTGRYRNAIRRKSRSMKKEGEVSTTIGIITSSVAMKYAAKVENKHRVFHRLDHEFRQPVVKDVKKGIRDGMKTFRVRGRR